MGFRGFCAALIAVPTIVVSLDGAAAQTPVDRIDAALQNITSISRTGRVGYATAWDGNKYVQCRRLQTREMRCEAAGIVLQPSLARILNAERQTRLTALGWVLDPAFGNYVRQFPADAPTTEIAGQVLKALAEAYAANTADLEISTAWVVDMPCPPRNGPSQNLAGLINDAKAMLPTAVIACSYKAPDPAQKADTVQALIALYGPSVTAEIQRLRINATRKVHVVFDSDIGYIQCMPEIPPVAFYCEAQSAESWAALSAVLTPDRTARLTAAGYAEPGRAPNYSKSYPMTLSDAAIAHEILSLLHDVYGYTGATKLTIMTE
ncbi:conserved hypothetical protein [Rhodopseudomonas palustris HaA2]|uniref:TY-Chap N-terminal domain-containing protein n=1 Tax=Rhodopseudomonas palustris (strain HaA2) TaxID=316058 RepID=Q2IV94_RHOP2|nr:hypothetical protein [Rhodopseudomonas palustris]ABD07866.1 conserved hypothetical protein [Rhodopseudomonas palustris HaA2]